MAGDKTGSGGNSGTETNPETGSEAAIVVGDHEFKSVDEVVKWGTSLEQSLGKQGEELGRLRSEVEGFRRVPPETGNGESKSGVDWDAWGVQILEDSGKAGKQLEEHILDKVGSLIDTRAKEEMEKGRRQSSETVLWNEFAQNYPWLKDRMDEVKTVTYGKLWPKIRDLEWVNQSRSVADYFKAQAKRTIDYLEGEELSGTRTTIESGGGSSGVGGNAPATTSEGDGDQKATFMDDISEINYVKKPPRLT